MRPTGGVPAHRSNRRSGFKPTTASAMPTSSTTRNNDVPMMSATASSAVADGHSKRVSFADSLPAFHGAADQQQDRMDDTFSESMNLRSIRDRDVFEKINQPEIPTIVSAMDEKSPLCDVLAEHGVPLVRHERDFRSVDKCGLANNLCLAAKNQITEALSRAMDLSSINNEHLYRAWSTWSLVQLITNEQKIGSISPLPADNSQTYTLQTAINDILARSAHLRKLKIIVDWLELSAQLPPRTNVLAVDHIQGWMEDTVLHRSDDSISIDPDCNLSSEDQKLEEQLLEDVWNLLRSGQLPAAIDLCCSAKRQWRAATLMGALPYFQTATEVCGNSNRFLWKSTCAMLSKTSNSIYEKAIYGLLSGNHSCALPICTSWEDLLWLHTKTLLEYHIDEELRKYKIPSSGDMSYTFDRESPKYSELQDIFVFLTTQDRPGVTSRYHQLQCSIIQNDISSIFTLLKEWASTSPPLPLLHFSTHLAILYLCPPYFVEPSLDIKRLFIIIINHYIDHLIESHQFHLVALYCYFIPSDKERISAYSNLLSRVPTSDRREMLELADLWNLNKTEITANISAAATSVSVTSTINTATFEKRVDAIKWLCFDETQWEMALRRANELLGELILLDKFQYAKLLTEEECPLPQKLLSTIQTATEPIVFKLPNLAPTFQKKDEYNQLAIEYLELRRYLEARHVCHKWDEHKQKQPQAPTPPGAKGLYSERLLYQQAAEAYQLANQQWQGFESTLATNAEQGLILFLQHQPGFLESVTPEQSERLKALQKYCIPKTVELLQDLYFRRGQFKEALQVADLVASASNNLYKYFTTDRMAQFLYAVRKTVIELLRIHPDPIGINPQQAV